MKSWWGIRSFIIVLYQEVGEEVERVWIINKTGPMPQTTNYRNCRIAKSLGFFLFYINVCVSRSSGILKMSELVPKNSHHLSWNKGPTKGDMRKLGLEPCCYDIGLLFTMYRNNKLLPHTATIITPQFILLFSWHYCWYFHCWWWSRCNFINNVAFGGIIFSFYLRLAIPIYTA